MIKTERIRCDRATECLKFYKHVITNTPDMDRYGRWKIGLYPTEEDI